MVPLLSPTHGPLSTVTPNWPLDLLPDHYKLVPNIRLRLARGNPRPYRMVLKMVRLRALSLVKLQKLPPNSYLVPPPILALQLLITSDKPSRNTMPTLPNRWQLLVLTHIHCLGRVRMGIQFPDPTWSRTPPNFTGGPKQEALINRRPFLPFKGSRLPPVSCLLNRPLSTPLVVRRSTTPFRQVVPSLTNCLPKLLAWPGTLLTTRGAS